MGTSSLTGKLNPMRKEVAGDYGNMHTFISIHCSLSLFIYIGCCEVLITDESVVLEAELARLVASEYLHRLRCSAPTFSHGPVWTYQCHSVGFHRAARNFLSFSLTGFSYLQMETSRCESFLVAPSMIDRAGFHPAG